MRTLVRVLLILLVIFIGIFSLGYYWTFVRPIPALDAKYEINQLSDSVSIYWDSYHVPHIEAKNERDLYYSIGFIHAQERLWQMTIVQLAAEGRFSEFFGEKVLAYDSYQRALGFWRMAKKIELTLSDREKQDLQAYSDGVNDWATKHSKALPIEFSLVNMEPIPWTPTHSIALIRLLAWDLNVSWWSELAYARLATQLDSANFSAIVPTWTDSQPTSISFQEWKKTGQLMGGLLDKEFDVRKLTGSTGSHIGSNAWVIDGSKTSTGFPLLAGDPHLGLNIPGKWFEIHASLNGRELSGATHPGAPIVVIGQNDFFAWSFTNIMADDTDFYLEKRNPADRGQYLKSIEDGKLVYANFEYDRSYIKQQNGDEVVSEVKMTQNGVVISDFITGSKLPDSLLISMRWTGHELSDEFNMMLQLNWAQSFDEVKQLVPQFSVPGQNMIYADKTGNIALFSMAKLPIRTRNPLILADGWIKENQWKSWIPQQEMPKVINPEKGWIANANNKLVANPYPHYIGTFYEPDSRINQIEKVLTSKKVLTESDFEQLQSDVFSHHAQEISGLILPILENHLNDEDLKIAHTYLTNWDFKFTKSATAASIFDVFFTKLVKNTLADEMDETTFTHLTWLENIPVRIMKPLLESNSALFDVKGTDMLETKEEMVIQTMKESIAFLRTKFGDETYNWRWENLHTLTLEPLVFAQAAKDSSASSILKLIVKNVLSKGPYGVDGHGMTVNNAQYDWKDPFNVVLGPSIRRIVDLSDLRSTKSVIPGGQSGIPMSSHFDDQIDLWLNGKYKTLIQSMSWIKTNKLPKTILYPVTKK